MQHPATTALRRLSHGTIVLSCYGLVSMATLAVLGGAATGIHMFARTAAALVLIGLAILGVVGAGNLRARRRLLAPRPDLADAVPPGRYPPGNGMAVFVYVPFLVLVMYDRSCRAPYRGFLINAAQSESQYKLTAPG